MKKATQLHLPVEEELAEGLRIVQCRSRSYHLQPRAASSVVLVKVPVSSASGNGSMMVDIRSLLSRDVVVPFAHVGGSRASETGNGAAEMSFFHSSSAVGNSNGHHSASVLLTICHFDCKSMGARSCDALRRRLIALRVFRATRYASARPLGHDATMYIFEFVFLAGSLAPGTDAPELSGTRNTNRAPDAAQSGLTIAVQQCSRAPT